MLFLIGIVMTVFFHTPWGIRVIGLGSLIFGISLAMTNRTPLGGLTEDVTYREGGKGWGIGFAILGLVLLLGAGKIYVFFMDFFFHGLDKTITP